MAGDQGDGRVGEAAMREAERELKRAIKLTNKGKGREALALASASRDRAAPMLSSDELAEIDAAISDLAKSVRTIDDLPGWIRPLWRPFFFVYRWAPRVAVVLVALAVLHFGFGVFDGDDSDSSRPEQRQAKDPKPAKPDGSGGGASAEPAEEEDSPGLPTEAPESALADAEAQVIATGRAGIGDDANVDVECSSSGHEILCVGTVADPLSGASQSFSTQGSWDPATDEVTIDPDAAGND